VTPGLLEVNAAGIDMQLSLFKCVQRVAPWGKEVYYFSPLGEIERGFSPINPGILNSNFYVPPTNLVLKNVKEWH